LTGRGDLHGGTAGKIARNGIEYGMIAATAEDLPHVAL
jgi:6-phosphogluconate dehydrogenase (decarboxylating)